MRQTIRHEPAAALCGSRPSAADGRLYFTLDAADRDGRFINGAEASVTVGSPRPPGEGGKSAEVRLTQIAPGCYAGSQAAGQGTYWLSGQVRRNGELIDSVRSGTVVLYMPEVAAKLDGTVQAAEKSGLRTMPLWPWLLGAGLIVLVVDLAVRRMDRAVQTPVGLPDW